MRILGGVAHAALVVSVFSILSSGEDLTAEAGADSAIDEQTTPPKRTLWERVSCGGSREEVRRLSEKPRSGVDRGVAPRADDSRGVDVTSNGAYAVLDVAPESTTLMASMRAASLPGRSVLHATALLDLIRPGGNGVGPRACPAGAYRALADEDGDWSPGVGR